MAGPWEKYGNTSEIPQTGPWEKYGNQKTIFPQAGPMQGEMISTTQPGVPSGGSNQNAGFLNRSLGDVSTRFTNIQDMVNRRAPAGDMGITGAIKEIVAEMPGTATLAAGEAAGIVPDIIGEGIRSGYKNFVPERTQEGISEFGKKIAGTKIGQMGLGAMQKGGEIYQSFKREYPDAAMALEGIFNISSLAVGGGASKQVAKETTNIVSDISTIAGKTIPDQIDKEIFQTVKGNIVKAIRPGVEGKRTFNQANKYFNNAKEAVEEIINNKGNLKIIDSTGEVVNNVLPRSLSQFSQSISQTKKTIFQQYDDLAKQAGTSGATVDLAPISKELDHVAFSPEVNDLSPDIAKYTKNISSALSKRGKYTTSEAQNAITRLNDSLESFYTNPSYETASKASIDAMVANAMRKQLDDTISSATGVEYQALKNKYGSLSAIERDVNRRMIVDLRKNTKGLIDFSDIFSGSQVVSAIINKSPAAIATATTAKGIAKFYKHINDPNRFVKKMFSDVENLSMKKAGVVGEFAPKSATGEFLINLRDGMAEKYKRKDDIAGLKNIVAEVKEGLDSPTYLRRGVKPGLGEITPPSPASPAEISANVFEDIIRTANSPKGKELLLRRLAEEERYSNIIDDVLNVPTTKALPPGQGFELLSPAESGSRIAAGTLKSRLGIKNITDVNKGRITTNERRKINARRRGLTKENP